MNKSSFHHLTFVAHFISCNTKCKDLNWMNSFHCWQRTFSQCSRNFGMKRADLQPFCWLTNKKIVEIAARNGKERAIEIDRVKKKKKSERVKKREREKKTQSIILEGEKWRIEIHMDMHCVTADGRRRCCRFRCRIPF